MGPLTLYGGEGYVKGSWRQIEWLGVQVTRISKQAGH